ncbi:MAG TPA: HD domain-containing protein, partial [Spirochaetota bacterium]|nr:HD domain-containing protein [Spirochaetota bacterium]
QLSQHLAQAIRYHHVDYIQWKENNAGGNIPMASHIIHVADRVDVLINRRKDFLLQKDDILATLKKYSGRRFDPEIVKCFEEVSAKESFWFDLQFDSIDEKIKSLIAYNPMLSLHDIHEISTLFTKIIDFRSRFTAAHSTSVANVARELGSLLNLSKRECLMLDIAGHLHDIGKLAIPLTILEKQGPLTKEEWTIMKQHVYFTYIILTVIDSPEFRIINEWASYHHERQDGRGYPFKITKDNLTIGSRIMAVADIFTALAEERPYRSAMDDNKIVSAMNKAKKDLLDPMIVEAMLDNYSHFKELRSEAFRNSLKEFKEQFDF